ncbi:MAG TPA: hypothetical protein PKI71_08130 [Candidatus Rifleibacterium sp.]|nr:hypothetical protein [Candidatus Rifleibacterium sp.]
MKPVKFDFNAFYMIEETTGRGVPALLVELSAATSDPVNKRIFSPLARLYWAGRLHEIAGMSLREAIAELQSEADSQDKLAKFAESLINKVMESGLLGGKDDPPKQESPAQ